MSNNALRALACTETSFSHCCAPAASQTTYGGHYGPATIRITHPPHPPAGRALNVVGHRREGDRTCREGDRTYWVPSHGRALRIEFPGAVYQVVSRFHLVVYAYCLMDNHYHLLLETREANLSRAMRQLNGVYAQGFNRRHGQVGHVLQRRSQRSWSIATPICWNCAATWCSTRCAGRAPASPIAIAGRAIGPRPDGPQCHGFSPSTRLGARPVRQAAGGRSAPIRNLHRRRHASSVAVGTAAGTGVVGQ